MHDRSPHAGEVVELRLPTTVRLLAEALGVPENDVLKEAFRAFGFGSVNLESGLVRETAVRLAKAFDVELRARE